MTKNVLNRMLEKNERNRIKRNFKRKFRRLHPNWETGMVNQPHRKEKIYQVNRTRFRNIFQKRKDGVLSKFIAFIRRIFGRKV